MNTRKIQMPREVYIGPDVIYETGEICKDLHLDNKVLVLTGPNTYDIAAKHAIESLENQDIEVDVKIVEKVSYDLVKVSLKSIFYIKMYFLFQCQLLLHMTVLYLL